MKYLKVFWADDGAATAIEFALLSPVFFLLLMGCVEFSLIFFASTVLENATTNGARQGMTGSTYGSTQTREQYITQQIVNGTSGLLKAQNVVIQTQVYDNFGSATAGNGATQTNNYGAGCQTVLYQVTYPWKLFTPLVGKFFTNNQVTLQATTIVPNECF